MGGQWHSSRIDAQFLRNVPQRVGFRKMVLQGSAVLSSAKHVIHGRMIMINDDIKIYKVWSIFVKTKMCLAVWHRHPSGHSDILRAVSWSPCGRKVRAYAAHVPKRCPKGDPGLDGRR